MSITIYSMYNNKGGVGKTTLGFNIASQLAEQNPDTQVLVIDMCPQANISQYLLGGGNVGYKTNQSLQSQKSRRNVVGFLDWLMDGNSDFKSIKRSFKININEYNNNISKNVYLIAGDSFLESLSLALNYAVLNPANRYAWPQFMTAIRRLCELEFDKEKYKKLAVFIDCNPSFSIYTQMALVSSDYLIIPMMADYSSLEGLKGIMTLLFGKYPTAASKNYADKFMTFANQVETHGLKLPKLWEFIFNNFTSNQGVAAAYEALKLELADFCYQQYIESPELFAYTGSKLDSREDWEDYYLSLVKDFHTSGKVSASLGIPLYKLEEKEKYTMPNGEIVTVTRERYKEARKHVSSLVERISC
ncbi:ParA family protein [uncultured Tolumonas sp.]|uniref:ParA family protein n=1 Tax=uncultured Tolumonas sp. TaxID=263765 RepID=UPI002A0A938B|nr:ParA family protein [uncultured Tolumonas sp.]